MRPGWVPRWFNRLVPGDGFKTYRRSVDELLEQPERSCADDHARSPAQHDLR
jgi:hypothetical protein